MKFYCHDCGSKIEAEGATLYSIHYIFYENHVALCYSNISLLSISHTDVGLLFESQRRASVERSISDCSPLQEKIRHLQDIPFAAINYERAAARFHIENGLHHVKRTKRRRVR